MVAIGMQLVGQWSRQPRCGACDELPDLRQMAGEVLLHLVEEVRIALGDLRHQQGWRHAEGLQDLRRAQQRRERRERGGEVFARRLRVRRRAFAHGMRGRAEQLRDAMAHDGRGGYDRHAEQRAQHAGIHVGAVGRRLVHLVQRDHQRPAEIHQLQRQFEVVFERRGVDHLHDDVRWRERRRRASGLVQRDGRALVAPQQVLQGRAIGRLEVVRRADARQVDHARFVQADLHGAFVVGAARVRQLALLHRRARDRCEEGALAAVGQPDQRDAQRPLAAKERLVQRDGGRVRGGGLHQGLRRGKAWRRPATALGIVRTKRSLLLRRRGPSP